MYYITIVHQIGHLPRADSDVISVGQTNICVRISIIPMLSISLMDENSGACKLWYIVMQVIKFVKEIL